MEQKVIFPLRICHCYIWQSNEKLYPGALSALTLEVCDFNAIVMKKVKLLAGTIRLPRLNG